MPVRARGRSCCASARTGSPSDAGGMVTDVRAQRQTSRVPPSNRELLARPCRRRREVARARRAGREARGELERLCPGHRLLLRDGALSVQAVAIVDDGTDVLGQGTSPSRTSPRCGRPATAAPHRAGRCAFLVHTHGITPIVPGGGPRVLAAGNGVRRSRSRAKARGSRCRRGHRHRGLASHARESRASAVWVVDSEKAGGRDRRLADVLAVVAADRARRR